MNKLNTVITKLDEEILKLCAEDASALQETRDPKAPKQPEDDNNHLSSHDPLESDSGHKQHVEDGDDQSHTMPSPSSSDIEQISHSSFDCNHAKETGKELVVKIQGSENENCNSPESQTNFLETENDTKRVNDKGKEKTNIGWITVG